MSHMSKVCIFSAVGAAVGMKIGPASDVCRSDSATPGATKIDVTVITASQSSPEDYKEADYKEALHQCNEVIGSSRSTDDFDGIQGGCESDDEGPHDIIIAKFGNQPVGALDFYIQDEVVNVNYLGVHRNCQGKFGVGTELMNKFVEHVTAVQFPASSVELAAVAVGRFNQNRLVSFYNGFGFDCEPWFGVRHNCKVERKNFHKRLMTSTLSKIQINPNLGYLTSEWW